MKESLAILATVLSLSLGGCALKKPITQVEYSLDEWLLEKGRKVRVENDHGLFTHVNAYLFKPKGKSPFPAVVYCHGGFGMKKEHLGFAEKLRDEGYVVIAPFYPGEDGSDGLDRVYPFEVQSVLDCLRHLEGLPYIDKKNIGLMGCSHGGWITLGAIEKTNDFDAAVDVAGIADMVDLYKFYFEENGTTGVPQMDKLMKEEVILYFEGGTFEEVPQNYIRDSPIYHVEKINTPLLIIHGAEDQLIPVRQIYKLGEELEKHEKDYEMVILEGVGHDSIDGEKILEFFEKYLKDHS